MEFYPVIKAHRTPKGYVFTIEGVCYFLNARTGLLSIMYDLPQKKSEKND